MSDFPHYFSLGFIKIAYLDVFVHILFIIALCGIYTFKSVRLIATYAACFVLGYLITFILSAFGIINAPAKLLPFLLPLTTIIVSVSNFFLKKNAFTNKYSPHNYRYFLALAGGLLHGLDFPAVLGSALESDKLFLPVLAFNMGILSALILTISFLLITAFILTYLLRVNIREWNLILSGACAGISIYIIMNAFFYTLVLK
ncbi:MAG: HupE/UreJ family protein [Sporocytophaga sp.]|uniref:HupE/UreJ family protein n=1 Tax=Sporocytophaga sp. TaxID=2231183 RepID=UPI001B20017F|nr:HupE/UreJ family protein [Sporocytophaga sp.]MBO9699835.1 HupE/UreJ family protein [Sporocytophaga sp.]